MIVLIAGVAGGFLVLIIAIVVVCILMRNIQRNSAKKAAENAQRMAKSANDDTVSFCLF
jgi:Na+-transporting methylmalonyl-CoA/oxaloacetate decarboxylase gamma subunit